MSSESKLVTIREMARHLKRFGATVAWLKMEAESGRIPAVRIRNHYAFDPTAVEKSLLGRAASVDQAPNGSSGNVH